MKKIFLLIVFLIISTIAFAENKKETKEYWQKQKFNEEVVKEEMDKCWNNHLHQYFKIEEGSSQWNICCAIQAAYFKPTKSVKQLSKEYARKKRLYTEVF